MFKKILAPLLISFLSLTASAQENSNITSAIKVESMKNGFVTISGICSNNTFQPKELKYEFSVQKRSLSGNISNNNQSGHFILDSKDNRTVSTTRINFDPQDYTEIVLTIYDAHNTQLEQHKKLITVSDFAKK
jgi:hypothetical protein